MPTLSTSLIRRSFSRTFAVAMIGFVAACNSSSDVNSPSQVATTLSASSGVDGQTVAVGQSTPTGISVVVLDQNGAALLNAAVTWTVLTGNGSVSAATSTTNASGVASIVWTVGTTAGTNTLQATLATGASVTITAIAVAGVATTFTVVSGNNQAIALGAMTAPMQVLAADAYGNPVSGVSVTWGASAGTLSAATSTTDVNGLASVTLTADSTTTSYIVTANSGNLSASYAITAN